MSRSRRKTPIMGNTTAVSEATDKAIWHRRRRRGEQQRLGGDPESEPISRLGYSSTWLMDKDGKRYLHEAPDDVMRK